MYHVAMLALVTFLVQPPSKPIDAQMDKLKKEHQEKTARFKEERTQVPEYKSEMRKKMVCVMVCPPGLFRKARYEWREVTEEVKVATYRDVVKRTVLEWKATSVFGLTYIENIPDYSSGRVDYIHKDVKDIMLGMQYLSSNSDLNVNASKQKLIDDVDLLESRGYLESLWFQSQEFPGKEFQFLLTMRVNTESKPVNPVTIDCQVRERTYGTNGDGKDCDEQTALKLIKDMFKKFPKPMKWEK